MTRETSEIVESEICPEAVETESSLGRNISPDEHSADTISVNLSEPRLFSSACAALPLTEPLLLCKEEDEMKKLRPVVERISSLAHLAVFGILGVITRYLLQRLFGPGVANVTNDHSILYLDLPSNMVGSFLMGWFGIVFKSEITQFSDQLAMAISTGYLGSLTTFSGWNQKMLDLSLGGHWVFAILGFVIGLFLAAYSITFGIEAAKGFKWLLRSYGRCSDHSNKFKLKSYNSQMIVLLILIFLWGGLWAMSFVLDTKLFKKGGSAAQLWLGCIVGPFGVWIRWSLASWNVHGLCKGRSFDWIPFGTLTANVSAACIMAMLALVKKAVNTKDCDTIASGIQFGFLGCLSTVSTFMAEFNAMRESSHPWRAYAYATITISVSFGLGTLMYSLPVWLMGLN